MKLENILNFSFLEFTSSNELADEIFDIVSSLPNVPDSNLHNSIIHRKFYNEKLNSWFYQSLEEVHTYLDLKKDIKLQLTECWVNKTLRYERHHNHRHPNSFLSGVYYPEDNNAPIQFSHPNLWFEHFRSMDLTNSMNIDEMRGRLFGPSVTGKYFPKKGSLLIFPSHIQHHVPVAKQTRYSIAFNTFFSGTIGTNYGSKLEIKVFPFK